MTKGTSIKDAIKQWEETTGQNAAEATEVSLCFQYPPIDKMDNSLSVLAKCEKLSLSTNCIEKIAGVSALKKLKILALGRNQIKNFTGLEGIGDTLEQLWISYNIIEKMKGVNYLKNLKVLLMSNNLVKDWKEFELLKECTHLEELVFVGNPLYENTDETNWRNTVAKILPHLKTLDGATIIRDVE